jgi:hypothetical protein
MKKIVTLIIVMLVTIGLYGQGKWDLAKPVTLDRLVTAKGDKAGTGAWFFRINAALTATTIQLQYNETGEFTGFKSAFLSKAGMGLSYAHYIEADGVVKNNYSVNGLALMPVDGDTNIALAVTGSFYNVSAGFGYNCMAGPFKQNIFGLFGVQIAF